MSRLVIERREILLPPLPLGSESSLRVVDLVHDDGSVKRLWLKDDGIQVLGLTAVGEVIAIAEKGYTHLVGGYIEPGEEPETAARRELLEETGYEADVLRLLAAVNQDSGGSERAIWLYLATGCRKLRDSEAGINVTLMPSSEFWRLITAYIEVEPGTKRKGLMSLTAATLAFNQLGIISMIAEKKEEVSE